MRLPRPLGLSGLSTWIPEGAPDRPARRRARLGRGGHRRRTRIRVTASDGQSSSRDGGAHRGSRGPGEHWDRTDRAGHGPARLDVLPGARPLVAFPLHRRPAWAPGRPSRWGFSRSAMEARRLSRWAPPGYWPTPHSETSWSRRRTGSPHQASTVGAETTGSHTGTARHRAAAPLARRSLCGSAAAHGHHPFSASTARRYLPQAGRPPRAGSSATWSC